VSNKPKLPSAEKFANRITYEISGRDEDSPAWDVMPQFLAQEFRAYGRDVLKMAIRIADEQGDSMTANLLREIRSNEL